MSANPPKQQNLSAEDLKRSYWSYPGAKAQAGIFQRIIGQMPPHSTYVECFFGSGAVYRNKVAARESILIDLHHKCIARISAGAGVIAITGDVLKLLPLLKPALPADTLVYVDPPYMLETRQGRLYYENELSDDQHALLLTLLQGLHCKVLLSHPPCPLYSSQLQNWRCIKYTAMTRGGKKPDALWCNFPEPEELHDWRYAGKTFRERCALKRKATRWVKDLEQMRPRERGYVLNAIAQRQAQRWAADSVRTDGAISKPMGQEPSPGPALVDVRIPPLSVKVTERKETGERSYVAKAFLGDLRVWESDPPTARLGSHRC